MKHTQAVVIKLLELQQIFNSFGYSLEFRYSDSIRLHLHEICYVQKLLCLL